MERVYRIAEIVICLKTPFDFQEEGRFRKFAVQPEMQKKADYTVVWEATEIPEIYGGLYMELADKRYYRTETEWVEECVEGAERKPFCWLHMEGDGQESKTGQFWLCRYRKQKEQNFFSTAVLFHNIGFPIMLGQKRTLLLHCSYIKVGRTGILFSGPSGVGKSTQASLWRRYAGAEILNGDRAAIRLSRGRWRAYGLPYAGSSEFFRNETLPVGAVICLGQSRENWIEKLRGAEAFRTVWRNLFQSYALEVLQESAVDTLSTFLENVPVYRMDCRPDRSAVECLKNRLTEEGLLWI